jgi:hypothetical protein
MTKVTIVEHYQFPASDGAPSDEIGRLKTLQKARKTLAKRRSQVRELASTGQTKKAAARIWSALNGHSALICAGVDNEKNKPASDRKSLAEVFELASECQWSMPPNEPVTVWAKKKGSGEFRPICDFGPKRRLMNTALSGVLRCTLIPQPFQFDCGKNAPSGIPGLIHTVKLAIGAGYVWAVVLDIERFFSNFTKEGLVTLLPLRKKLITHFVLGDQLAFTMHGSSHVAPLELLQQASLGAPQGSPVSAIVGTMIVSKLTIPKGVRLFNFADNFLVLGTSKSSAESAADALIAQVQGLPGGHFTLKTKQKCTHVNSGISFLGYSMQVKKKILAVTPANLGDFEAALNRYDNKISRLIFGLGKGTPEDLSRAKKLVGDAFLMIESWAAFFRECDPEVVQEEVTFGKTTLEQHYFKPLGLTHSKVAKHKNPAVQWKWTSEQPFISDGGS